MLQIIKLQNKLKIYAPLKHKNKNENKTKQKDGS